MGNSFEDLDLDRLPQARYVPPEASYLAWVDCRTRGPGLRTGAFAVARRSGRSSRPGGR